MATVNVKRLFMTGFVVMISAFLFGVAETLYFGSNWLPKSNSELVCDSIALLFCGIGEGLIMLSVALHVKAEIKKIREG